MNIGETKHEFGHDINIEDYEILKTEKLHLNVSTITVKIKDDIIKFGYSYHTIIAFSLYGYTIRTNEVFSTSTQKHKSQVIDYETEIIDIEEDLYKYLLNEILSGRNITIAKIKKFIIKNNYLCIKTNTKNSINAMEYLRNNKIIDSNYYGEPKKEIKETIKEKLWRNKEVTIKNNKLIHISKTNNKYRINDNKKEYKNLSFLNKLELEKITQII